MKHLSLNAIILLAGCSPAMQEPPHQDPKLILSVEQMSEDIYEMVISTQREHPEKKGLGIYMPYEEDGAFVTTITAENSFSGRGLKYIFSTNAGKPIFKYLHYYDSEPLGSLDAMAGCNAELVESKFNWACPVQLSAPQITEDFIWEFREIIVPYVYRKVYRFGE